MSVTVTGPGGVTGTFERVITTPALPNTVMGTLPQVVAAINEVLATIDFSDLDPADPTASDATVLALITTTLQERFSNYEDFLENVTAPLSPIIDIDFIAGTPITPARAVIRGNVTHMESGTNRGTSAFGPVNVDDVEDHGERTVMAANAAVANFPAVSTTLPLNVLDAVRQAAAEAFGLPTGSMITASWVGAPTHTVPNPDATPPTTGLIVGSIEINLPGVDSFGPTLIPVSIILPLPGVIPPPPPPVTGDGTAAPLTNWTAAALGSIPNTRANTALVPNVAPFNWPASVNAGDLAVGTPAVAQLIGMHSSVDFIQPARNLQIYIPAAWRTWLNNNPQVPHAEVLLTLSNSVWHHQFMNTLINNRGANPLMGIPTDWTFQAEIDGNPNRWILNAPSGGFRLESLSSTQAVLRILNPSFHDQPLFTGVGGVASDSNYRITMPLLVRTTSSTNDATVSLRPQEAGALGLHFQFGTGAAAVPTFVVATPVAQGVSVELDGVGVHRHTLTFDLILREQVFGALQSGGVIELVAPSGFSWLPPNRQPGGSHAEAGIVRADFLGLPNNRITVGGDMPVPPGVNSEHPFMFRPLANGTVLRIYLGDFNRVGSNFNGIITFEDLVLRADDLNRSGRTDVYITVQDAAARSQPTNTPNLVACTVQVLGGRSAHFAGTIADWIIDMEVLEDNVPQLINGRLESPYMGSPFVDTTEPQL
jgi:hypothetical protein